MKRNATPKVKYVTHGDGSKILEDPLDYRTRVGKAYLATCQALSAHIGGEPTLPQQELINQAARLALLGNIAWGELLHKGVFDNEGKLSNAFDAFIRTADQQRQVLRLLGLNRAEKELPTLGEYLAAKEKENADNNH